MSTKNARAYFIVMLLCYAFYAMINNKEKPLANLIARGFITLSTIEIFNVQNCAFTLFLFPLLPFSRALSRIRLSASRLSRFA